MNSETFASELFCSAHRALQLKAPWRLLARLPEPTRIGSLLMLDDSVSLHDDADTNVRLRMGAIRIL